MQLNKFRNHPLDPIRILIIVIILNTLHLLFLSFDIRMMHDS